MICDMLQVYWAMIQYYILRLPYPVMVLVLVTIWYVPLGLVFCFLPWGARQVIRIVQWCLFQVSKFFPALENICGKADGLLNSWGLWLEGSEDMEPEEDGNGRRKGKKRLPVLGIYVLIILAICIFVIVPYYLESRLTGNSQQVCAEINQLVEKRVAHVQEYVDQYYAPKIQEEVVEEEPAEAEEIRILLHLGSKGWDGSLLRSSPEKIPDNVICTVYKDVELYFEHEIQESGGIVWVKVSTDEIPEAWISRNLLDEEEAEMYLQL